MKPTVDKAAYRVACDLIEEAGFDPAVVAFFRRACAPTVDEVLPLAIQCLRAYRDGPTLRSFFQGRSDETDIPYLTETRSLCEDSGLSEGVTLCTLLLQMSPSQRKKVARRARQEIEAERRNHPSPLMVNGVAYSWVTVNNGTPLADMRRVMEQQRAFTVGYGDEEALARNRQQLQSQGVALDPEHPEDIVP